jgi:hypothetical protein
MRYAKNLHHAQPDIVLNMMEKAESKTRGKALATAFISEGYKGADCVALIATSPRGLKYEGFIVYDLDKQAPIFIKEEERYEKR